jgi:AcrR family transcriptional regulator
MTAEPTDEVNDADAAGEPSVQERLTAAIDQCVASLQTEELGSITIEDVAQIAGLSRATAYRYLGNRDEVLYLAALALTRDHTERIGALMASLPTFAERLEEAFAYTAREIKRDPRIAILHHTSRTEPVDRAIHTKGVETLAPSLIEGRENGQVRTDVSVDELIDWTSEQIRIVARSDRSEEEIRLWVRHFVEPAFRPPVSEDPKVGPQIAGVLAEMKTRLHGAVDEAVASAQQALR